MSKAAAAPEDADLGTLAHSAFRNSKKLLSQQLELLCAEIDQELRRAAAGGLSMAAGGGLAAAGGLMGGLMLVHLVRDVTRLPLWCCYGLVGGACGAAAVRLLRAGRADLAGVRLVPRQTVEALEENLTWLKEQVTPAAG